MPSLGFGTHARGFSGLLLAPNETIMSSAPSARADWLFRTTTSEGAGGDLGDLLSGKATIISYFLFARNASSL